MKTAVVLTMTLGASFAFRPFPRSSVAPSLARRPTIRSSAEAVATEETASSPGRLLSRDRYIASNRFEVRNGKDAKFEARWANRKSRLASLDGFQWFALMRRVTLDGMPEPEDDPFNYVSFTSWTEKKHFNAWRQGEAFKEAHGGTSITAFMGAMISSLRVLKGAPRPAFYDGLLLSSVTPTEVPEVVDGWRAVTADGVNLLPPEAFVAQNRFCVVAGQEEAFEQRWASRESKLKDCDGFVGFTMLRRDAKTKGHGTVPLAEGEANYVSTTIWRDRAAFESWRKSQAFGQAHGSGEAKKGPTASSADAAESSEDAHAAPAAQPAMPWAQPPTPVFYEAKLVISSEKGL